MVRSGRRRDRVGASYAVASSWPPSAAAQFGQNVVVGSEDGSLRNCTWAPNAQREKGRLWCPSTSAMSRCAWGIWDQTATAATSGVAGSWVGLATSTLGCGLTCKRCGGLVAARGHPAHDPGSSSEYSQAK